MATLDDPDKILKDFAIVNANTLLIEYEDKAEKASVKSRANIFIAVFTTCWARLKLYGVLERTGRNCLYYDTDSVIYKRDILQKPLVETGRHLGDLTSELDEGDHIVEFASTGPKSYAFRTKKGRNICKVKGCTLNYRNSGRLNFDALKNFVLNGQKEQIITTYPNTIVRSKDRRTITSGYTEKTFRHTYSKRVIQDDLDTLPYGF